MEPTVDSYFTLDVSFVSDEEIKTLNHRYRHKNRPTDVLSFAQHESEEFLPPAIPGLPANLGDLVISIETADRQAAERHHSLMTEVAFLTIHGTLHLCGYDHDTSHHRRVMWKWQEEIFARVMSPLLSKEGPGEVNVTHQ